MIERDDHSFSQKIRKLQTYTQRLLKMILVGVLVLSVSSCMAQQADLVRIQQEFDAKIAKIDQDKIALEATLAQANQAIQESKKVLAKQKSEVAELVRARAQFHSELRSLREENLPQLSGDLETESHRLQRLERVVDDLKADLKHRITTLGENVEKEFDQQGKTMSKHMAGFRASLVEFKDALAGIDTRVVTESTRAMTAETNMKNDLEAQQTALQVKLDSDTNMLKQYLETDVKTSISSVAKTLQKMNVSLGMQLDTQGKEFKSQAALLSDLNTKVGTELASLKQQDVGAHQNLENLTKAMTQLRNGLDKVGAQLGSKVDAQAHALEQSSGRLKQLQGQYAALSKKLDADTKALRGYLDTDIRTSLQSMAQAVEAGKIRATQSSKKLEDRIQKLERTINADVKPAQAQVGAQDKHVKDLNQSVLSMREVLDSMAGMLGKRSDEQMKQIVKLTAQLNQMRQTQSAESAEENTNLQTLSSHVNKITTSVQSVVTTLDQVNTSLSSRLDDQVARLAEQERRLTETANNSVSSQRLNQELFANVQQLNQLTMALGQLKGVVNNIGVKLGKKVDEHEGQLAGLAQQVRQLQSSSSPTTSMP